MKKFIFVLCGVGVLLGVSLRAQTSPADVIADTLYPTDLLLRYHEAINITAEQKAWFQTELDKNKQRVTDLQARLQKEKDALGVLLKKDSIDEEAALAQAEKALNIDRDIKYEHLALMVRVKNKLTPGQRARLDDIKAHGAAVEIKLRKVQELAKRWQSEGRSLTKIQEMRDQFETLARDGMFKEAEEILDKALKVLEAK